MASSNNYVNPQIRYEESWTVTPMILLLPLLVLPLLLICNYSVLISRHSITFGYGIPKHQPWTLTSKTEPKTNIKPDSIVIGDASWWDNLKKFGGWGIRYSFSGDTIAYNPVNGKYIEFEELDSGKKYHFVSNNVDEVADLLRQGGERSPLQPSNGKALDANTEGLDTSTNGNTSVSDTDSNPEMNLVI